MVPLNQNTSSAHVDHPNAEGNIAKHETARRSLQFENAQNDVQMNEKSDRKRQNGENIEALVPAKRFKSD